MTIFVLLLALSSASCAGAAITCPEGGCGTMTIYLGPRWGSKVIEYPTHQGTKPPSTLERTETPHYRGTTRYQGELSEQSTTSGRWVPRARPITNDNIINVDYNVVELEARTKDSWEDGTHRPYELRSTSPGRLSHSRQIILDKNELIYQGVINFTGHGLTGDELKEALSQLTLTESEVDGSALYRTTRLYLSHNHISQLTRLVFPVHLEYSLLELRLDNNPILYLSANSRFELSRLASLKILSLANTGLRYLENLYTHSLEVLDLSGNRLSNVPLGLGQLQNLRELYLDNNRINSLYETPFSNLRDLRVLSLSGNYISQIWDSPFLNLYFLHTLKLNNNSLERIEQLSVHAVTKVYVGGNPMSCGCPLLDTLRRSWPDIADKDNLTCFFGDRDNLKLVRNLQEDDSLFDCSSHWTWLWSGSDQVEGWILWLQRHDALLITMVICALMASLMVIMAVRRCRHVKKKIVPKEIPYNVLDDNLLP